MGCVCTALAALGTALSAWVGRQRSRVTLRVAYYKPPSIAPTGTPQLTDQDCFILTTALGVRLLGYMTPTSSGSEFELSLVIGDVNDEIIDTLLESFDSIVSTHSGLTLVTVSCDGPDAVTAGLRVAQRLRELGVGVHRTHPDLVDRGEIARRAEVTTQAVGNWIRGERQSEVPFPAPGYLVGGGAWLWGDVNRWLEQNGKPHDDMLYPSLIDHARIDVRLTTSVGVQLDLRWNVVFGTPPPIQVAWTSRSQEMTAWKIDKPDITLSAGAA
jgi:hypothetical protein